MTRSSAATKHTEGFARAPERTRRSSSVVSTSKKKAQAGARVVVYVPPELAQVVRRFCLEQGRSLSDGATEALHDWVVKVRRHLGT